MSPTKGNGPGATNDRPAKTLTQHAHILGAPPSIVNAVDRKAIDFSDAGMLFLCMTHDHDCPGVDGKVSQCRCNPVVESVTQQEFVHRAMREARHE